MNRIDFIRRSTVDPACLVIGYDNSIYSPAERTLQVVSFEKIKKSTYELLDPANRFIANHLSQEEIDDLTRIFVKHNKNLKANALSEINKIDDVILAIDKDVHTFFTDAYNKVSIINRLYTFVTTDPRIILPDLSAAGTRFQDTKEKTFVEHEYHQANVLVIITKILTPLFGEIIARLNKLGDAFSSNREMIAVGIMISLIRIEFEELSNKLYNYTASTIEKILDNSHRDMMREFNGVSSESDKAYQFAKLFVKCFPNHDLYRIGGNLICSLSVSLKRSISSGESGRKGNQDISYRPMMSASESASDDDNNKSEAESILSPIHEALEVAPIAIYAVEQVIEKMLNENNIDRHLFDEAVSYYQTMLLPASVFNETLVALYLSHYLKTGYNIRYIKMNLMIKLVTIIQLDLIKHGFDEIVPLLSMIPSTIPKPVDIFTPDENAIVILNGCSPNIADINWLLSLSNKMTHLQGWSQFSLNKIATNFSNQIVRFYNRSQIAPLIQSQMKPIESKVDVQTGYISFSRFVPYLLFKCIYWILFLKSEIPDDNNR